MAKVTELGIFKDNKNFTPVKVNFKLSERQLFLHSIQCCEYSKIGNSNYSYDQIGTYNIIFKINSGDGICSFRGNENFVFIIKIEISEWYRGEDVIAKELKEDLSKYSILHIDDVLNAFKYRHYYRQGIEHKEL